MLVHVFRHPLGDCTNGGVSSQYDTLFLVNVRDGVDKAPPRYAPARLEPGNVPGTVKIVPADPETGEALPGWWMMGGNFAHTSDSRFAEAVAKISGRRHYGAVPIHDRQE